MNTLYAYNISEIKKEKNFLEKTLNVSLSIKGKVITMDGSPLNEYEAEKVIEAINLGFSAKTAILATDENFAFEKLNIKDFTKRKNLEIIRGRLIGTKGKTKDTIEQITGCKIKIKDNSIGVIGPAESVQFTITAIGNIIKGTKHANAYKYLEKINSKKRMRGDN